MKLLELKEKRLEDGNISIVLKPINRALEAAYLSIIFTGRDRSAFEQQMMLTDFFLTDCIKELKIAGESFDPNEVAERADIMDEGVVEELNRIFTLVIGEFNVSSEEDEKKSE